MSTRSVKDELQTLRFAWKWWSEVGPVQLRALPRVALNVKPVRTRHTPERGDVLRVLDAMTGWSRMVTFLLYATGARPGEVRDLTWGDVDLRNATLRMDGKTGERFVPIGPDAVAELRAWRGDAIVDPAASLWPITVSTFAVYGARYLGPACARAGVRRFTPYGLRRGAVDTMARAGIDIGTAAEITGHSPKIMLEHYRRVSVDDRRDAVRRAGLGSLGGNVVAFPSATE